MTRVSQEDQMETIDQQRILFVASLLCSLLLGCGSQDLGDADIGVATSALSKADVASVAITISGADISPDIVQELKKSKGQWRGVISNIPAGDGRTFTARAYNAASALNYEGATSGVTVAKGKPVTVIIVLQQKTAPTPFTNSSPAITSLVASSTELGPSESASLAVSASDPDGDALTYAWTATGGTFSGANTATPSWTAPATAGKVTLTATVSDGNGASAGLSVSVDVRTYHARGSASLSTSFNTWPVVSQVSASPGHVAVSGTVSLSVSASDSEGHTLSYSWSQGSCAGSFSSSTAQSPTWTAPATAPSTGSCPLQVTVSDGNGGGSTGTVTVKVAPLATANAAPQIASSYQSHETLAGGETVTLRVVTTDPEGAALTISWTTTAGTLGAASTGANAGTYTGENTLAAPASCTSAVTVTASISDGVTSTDATFSLPCSGPLAVGIGGGTSDDARAVARDSAGNVYVAGVFTGTAVFGSTTLTSAGTGDLFVAKMDAAGTYQWAVRAGGASLEVPYSLALDPSGNVYVAGRFQGAAAFGSTTLTPAGASKETFIAKLTTKGSWLWANQVGGSTTDYWRGVVVDAAGNAYLAGTFNTSVVFGSITLTTPSNTDIFVAKLTASGTFAWAVQGGSKYYTELASGIAMDASGDLYVTGYFQSPVTFGSTTLTSAGGWDLFVAKLSSAGTYQWAVRAGGAASDQTNDIASDGAGGVYITGTYTGPATFGSTTLAVKPGYANIFVARLSIGGAFQWARSAAVTSMPAIPGPVVAAHSSGAIYLAGTFATSAILGSTTLTSAGDDDVFVARLDSSGAFTSATRAGGAAKDQIRDMAAVSSDSALVVGAFQSTATFGGATLTSSGFDDAFVWGVAP